MYDPLAERMARRLRILAEPTRIMLLHELRDTELSVQELTEALDTSQQNASKHLSLLHEAGFLRRRKHGVYARYSIADQSVFALLELVRAGLEGELAEAQQAIEGRELRRSHPAPPATPRSPARTAPAPR
jgi:DNA-binding transcriptional ArsR family regulator